MWLNSKVTKCLQNWLLAALWHLFPAWRQLHVCRHFRSKEPRARGNLYSMLVNSQRCLATESKTGRIGGALAKLQTHVCFYFGWFARWKVFPIDSNDESMSSLYNLVQAIESGQRRRKARTARRTTSSNRYLPWYFPKSKDIDKRSISFIVYHFPK